MQRTPSEPESKPRRREVCGNRLRNRLGNRLRNPLGNPLGNPLRNPLRNRVLRGAKRVLR